MLNAWVYALAVEGWSDLALLSDPSEFGAVECHGESGGEADRGWRCLFSEMPHLCQFDSSEVSMLLARQLMSDFCPPPYCGRSSLRRLRVLGRYHSLTIIWGPYYDSAMVWDNLLFSRVTFVNLSQLSRPKGVDGEHGSARSL